MKKIISLLLSMSIMLSLATVSFAAETVSFLKSDAAGTTVSKGDTFTVIATINDETPLNTFKTGIQFDTDLFEVTSIVPDSFDVDMEEAKPMQFYYGNAWRNWVTRTMTDVTQANTTGRIVTLYEGKAAWNGASVPSKVVDADAGLVCATFKVIAEPTNDTPYTFGLIEDNSVTGLNVTVDSTVTVTVKGSAPAGPAAPAEPVETPITPDPETYPKSAGRKVWSVTIPVSQMTEGNIKATISNDADTSKVFEKILDWGNIDWSAEFGEGGSVSFNLFTNVLDAQTNKKDINLVVSYVNAN